MIKKILYIALLSASYPLCAAHYVDLYNAPLHQLNQLGANKILNRSNDLKFLSKTLQDKQSIERYQQMYKGIPIVGAQVTVTKEANPSALGKNAGLVNGHLFDQIDLDIKPSISSKEALLIAKQSYFRAKSQRPIKEELSELQIRADQRKELELVYLVSFKSIDEGNKPVWPYFIINAQTGVITKEWSNIQTFKESGPGGNVKVHEYWYGKDGLPGLEVTQNGEVCTMEDEYVRLVNLRKEWDWEGRNRIPFKYKCNNNVEDIINGSFSVGNDAYYFAHTVVNLFKDWYGLNVLHDAQGRAQKLIMRVHFGRLYDNAFWNGNSMSFGDGRVLYPLVSLEITGHEVAHGFTQQHANLEYHDESGALNESFSDMAGMAARAYLLEKDQNLYGKTNLIPNELTWTIGETIIPPSFPLKAIRYMDLPSLDQDSADCVDKKIARSNKSICAISYPELLALAEINYANDEQSKQGHIVHTASGIFNRAFYLLADELGVKTAFHIMLRANATYWTPTTDFKDGACGVLHAAVDLSIKPDFIQSTFNKVGIALTDCTQPRD